MSPLLAWLRRRGVAAAILLVATTIAVFAAPAVRVPLPDAPPRFLYDEPGLLSGGDRAAIEASLMDLDRQGVEIGVAIFKTIQGDPIEDVSIALAEKWRPGRKDRDNGLLIVIALEERKTRIEVGYGLEGVIPDAVAGRIIQYDMRPAFREKRFGDGISLAISHLARVARGEAIPEHDRLRPPPWLPLIFIVILPIVMVLLRAAARHERTLGPLGRRSRRGNWWIGPGGFGGSGGWGGGGWGGGGGGGGGGSFGGGSFGGGGSSGGW